MNINYQFSNIIDKIYNNGPIIFMPNGYTLLAPNGNVLKVLDLKKNTSRVLGIQLRTNIIKFDINVTGTHAYIATETGHCFYVNLLSDVILHRHLFSERVRVLKFSPDGRFIAIGISGSVIVYSIASLNRIQFNPFIQVNKFKHSANHINSLQWSDDGRLIAATGENRVIKVFSALKSNFANVGVYVLTERASLIDAFFFDEYDLITFDKSCKGSIWEGTLKADELVAKERQRRNNQSVEVKWRRLAFDRKKRFELNCHPDSSSSSKPTELTAISLNKRMKLLAAGYANGNFSLFELPGIILLQNLGVGEFKVNSIVINHIGNWVAVGCGQGTKSQLLVWEWQSESFILKQQSHSQSVTGASYSPDGSLIATGAEDGKVKIWKCSTSFCVVTFSDHESGITDICFTQSGKAVLSASLEGVIRAHDMKRYRNFQTMTAPRQTQLNSLCADQSGDLIFASSQDTYEIYIWSLETGQLVEALSGHTNLIAGLTIFGNSLCSVSHDKTVKVWNIVEGTCLDTIHLLTEGLDVKHCPAGMVLAVLCYDSSISLFDTRNNQQVASIDIRLDIDSQRQKTEKISKSTAERNKSFTCMAFSPDGTLILAGGQSHTFCLYSVADRIRIRTFKLNFNSDLIESKINSRRRTEFGNMNLFDLSDSDEDERNPRKKIRLPGTRHSDFSERIINQEINISKLAFSPTGNDFAVLSTMGVSIYSLNKFHRFDPFHLELGVTAASVVQLSYIGEHAKAISLALRLNNPKLTRKVVESVPISQIKAIVQRTEIVYAERLLAWLVSNNDGWRTHEKHFHFYQTLIREILMANAHKMKRSLDQNNRPVVTAIQQLVANQQNLIMKLCAQNLHALDYLLISRRMNAINTDGSYSLN